MEKFVMKLSDDSMYREVSSLEELSTALKTCPIACVKFHLRHGLNDFAEWSGKALKRADVALKLRQVKLNDMNPEETRRLLIEALMQPKPAEAVKKKRF
jgi:hypothetical protein